MTATLHSTDLDADRCPRCGIHLAGTDVVDKAKAWTALAEKNAEIARLKAALKTIADGHEAPHWFAAKTLDDGPTP